MPPQNRKNKKPMPKKSSKAKQGGNRFGSFGVNTAGSTYGASDTENWKDTPAILPVDSDLLEYTSEVNIVHGAGANNLRLVTLWDLGANALISDEETRIFDKFETDILVVGSAAAYTQNLFICTVKGPAAATFTAGDYDPAGGFKAALEAALAGGSEIKYFPVKAMKPYRDGAGTIRCEGRLAIDLKDHMNKFVSESERAISQGRTKGDYFLIAGLRGSATTTSIAYLTKFVAYHNRARKVVT